MIDTQDLDAVISFALASGHAKNETPVSLMIVSEKAEMGKTTETDKFLGTPGVEFVGDMTAHGTRRDLWRKINRGELRHIVIGEMLTPLSRAVGRDSFIATIQLLTTDGAKAIHIGFSPIMPQVAEPRTVGFIVCLPRSAYMRFHTTWVMSGFLSRFVVVTYTHNDSTIEAIFESIRRGDYLEKMGLKIPFGDEEFDIALPEDVALACEQLGRGIVNGVTMGYREVKHIRRLTKGAVILQNVMNGENRLVATMDDFKKVGDLDYLFGDQFNPLRPEDPIAVTSGYRNPSDKVKNGNGG